MASTTGATFVARLQSVIEKLGTNGTKVPDGVAPSNLQSNEEANTWHNTHNAIAEYLVASVASRTIEARLKKAKTAVEKALNLDTAKRVPGTDVTHVYDNVALSVKVANPKYTLDRAKLTTALAKRGVKDIDKIIVESENESTPARTLTASTTAE